MDNGGWVVYDATSRLAYFHQTLWKCWTIQYRLHGRLQEMVLRAQCSEVVVTYPESRLQRLHTIREPLRRSHLRTATWVIIDRAPRCPTSRMTGDHVPQCHTNRAITQERLRLTLILGLRLQIHTQEVHRQLHPYLEGNTTREPYPRHHRRIITRGRRPLLRQWHNTIVQPLQTPI